MSTSLDAPVEEKLETEKFFWERLPEDILNGITEPGGKQLHFLFR